ncbi:hypothetical protein VTL71DRAFT_13118 [Oculimacula yallundae]|uniref:Heterokaryon incompatibility domain-containing protein n=1 Tax=Oculimacula yallundae TaxID=86028 RepID=A0ABR4CPE0_9HELO
MLCEVCFRMGQSLDELFVPDPFHMIIIEEINGIDVKYRVQGVGYLHHKSVTDMLRAAKEGCELCRLIVDETRATKAGKTSLDLDESQIYARGLPSRHNGRIQGITMVAFYQSSLDDPVDITVLGTILGVYVLPDSPGSLLDMIHGELVEPHISRKTYTKAKSWIHGCLTTHPRCNHSLRSIPPRLIDVGPVDGSEEPRLIRNQGSRSDPWLALSHCWGGGISSATLYCNIEARMVSLPMSCLPTNFRDAIIITRELGFRYLWIDALCIIQDSRSDWELHLTLMGGIYQDAVLTIAADVASDSDTGIILRRDQAATFVRLPSRSSQHGLEAIIYFRPRLQDLPRGPLQTRGWTLQEDLLAVRTLSFSADQLLWQCQSKNISECHSTLPDSQGCRELGSEAYLKQSFLQVGAHSTAQTEFSIARFSREALEHWYLIVNEYVKRSLTVEQDRFPALSGIARQIELRTGYQYRFGIWLEDIHVGLLWSSHGTGRKQDHIVCPSWTWGGVIFPGSGPINLCYDIWSGPRSLTKERHTTTIHSRALVKDLDLTVSKDNAYMGVGSGRLSIQGKFKTASDWLKRHPRPLLYKENQRFDLSDLVQVRRYTDPMTDSPHIICELDYHEHWPDNWTDENRKHFEKGIAFIQIYRLSGYKDEEVHRANRGFENLRIAYALILESTGKEGEYRRRGMAEIPCNDGMADDGWETRSLEII